MCISAYLLGVKHGKCMSKGNVPPQPIKAIVEPIKAKIEDKENEPIINAIQNIMSYDASVAMQAVKQKQGR
jgi:hypothetical protein